MNQKLSAAKDLITSKTARQVLVLQKHSPKILFVAGVVGVVGTVVLACRATLKVSDVLDEHENDKRDAAIRHPMTAVDGPENFEKEVHKLKIKTALEIAKLYALPVVLGAASIGALTGAQVVVTRRNTALMAAYAAMDRAYKQYRDNVTVEYGVDADRQMASSSQTTHVEEKLADGTTKITKKHVPHYKRGASPYAVLFDEKSQHWTREPGMNPMILGMIQSHMNDQLRARGHLFLNEVHDRLGLPRTEAGQSVGWVYRKDNEEKNGDNYVSFGIFDGPLDDANAFLDGDELAIWLDFNVDGPIYKLIEKKDT